jgi:hypothetical protein
LITASGKPEKGFSFQGSKSWKGDVKTTWSLFLSSSSEVMATGYGPPWLQPGRAVTGLIQARLGHLES